LVQAAVLDERELTDRQGDVLDAALSLLVSVGDKLTMAGVAREASCSKETLYKWFGDRDGLLTAIVQWQAAKVRAPALAQGHLDAGALDAVLEQFGRDLLTVFTSETSLALNRLAVSDAGAAQSGLGAIVLENGRRAMGRRLKPVLEAARAAGLLAFEDSEEAFRTFFGLVVRDVHIRALLGDEMKMRPQQIEQEALRAKQQFLALYGG
jgi:AcrR family transcriptional regulator